MGKIRYGKWGAWIARVGVLLHLLALITAQPGFLSISCGGKTNHTAENNITWVTDADYIDLGQSADIGDASELAFGSYLHTLRFFPKPLNKSCYELPVSPNVRYLLRLWFAVGNFSGYQQWPINFAFSIETVDMLFVQNVTAENHDPFNYEYILITSGRAKYICLVRTSETHDPFISGIELRMLEDGMYSDIMFSDTVYSSVLVLESRVDAGGNSIVRYPRDKFDRIWATSPNFSSDLDVRNVSSAEPVSINKTQNLPPTAVMQTAWVVKDGSSFPLSGWETTNRGVDTLVVCYFADIETLNTSESRSFYFELDGAGGGDPNQLITLVRNYSALEYPTGWGYAPTNFQLVMATNSTLFPIINAYEYYEVVSPESAATYKQDIDALDVMKRRFNIKDWISDPCHLIPWNGIRCDNISGLIRISEIDLSGRNLTGSVPNDIARLTALVNVLLNNNHFTGPLPNFTNLIMLERLYLENNNLSGTLEWLSKLRNLKEWNIENNNFSGVIPGQLLLNCSLKLNYSGNPYLSTNKSECILQNSKSTQRNNTWRRKLKVLGISLSGILIIASASIAVSVVYGKKFWKKEEGVAIERPKK